MEGRRANTRKSSDVLFRCDKLFGMFSFFSLRCAFRALYLGGKVHSVLLFSCLERYCALFLLTTISISMRILNFPSRREFS